MSGKSYKLASIADVLLVPLDRRKAMFEELHLALLALELACGDEARSVFRPPFVWTDDGDSSVSIKAGSEELRLEVTRATGGA